MKKYLVRSSIFEIGVYGKTEGEARRRALAHFLSEIEKDLTIVDADTKRETCTSCEYACSPSDLTEIDGERLCADCFDNKVGLQSLSPEDIPF